MENQETRTFKIYPTIEMKPVRFKNRFGIELAGHLYLPMDVYWIHNPMDVEKWTPKLICGDCSDGG